MFAGTPRSGSTFICQKFWRTGLLGAPLEYANDGINHDLKQNIGDRTFSEYWQDIQKRRTSPNGIFSFKMFIPILSRAMQKYHGAIEAFRFDDVVFIYREDIVAQAVSYYRATQTRVWFKTDKEHQNISSNIEYDFYRIKKLLQIILQNNKLWERIFISLSVNPHVIKYEDAVRSDSYIMNIIEELNLEYSPDYVPNMFSFVMKQGDEINHIWKDRFLYDLNKSGGYHALLNNDTLPFFLRRG
nr:Stf0 family sulfotransferase [Neokomagataea anthophila]